MRYPGFWTEPLPPITPWLLPAGVEWACLRVVIPRIGQAGAAQDELGMPQTHQGYFEH